MSQAITPMLWFDRSAEAAVELYTSVFPNARVLDVKRYGEGAPLPAGTVLTIEFELNGTHFVALNGGPHYKLTPAVSFVIHCDTQSEVDHYWNRLTEGGEELPCGWLVDRFGVAWQVTPRMLVPAIFHPDPAKAQRATAAMMAMKKIDIAAIERALAG